ncbi:MULTISPECIES: glycosyltransferase family 4 protein [Pectobacterium]|uniref:glycosyltransferase family 4 protein n=1 Tax=Pectobacterium TaxID=122277 RepID=UPI001889B15C|nr:MULTISPECIES: glycosyltransferase family 4 protein [Pectobacterium]MBG0751212.1 hypothetical protein [Pectobacterium carotovorum subsp. carotovorum PCCS1]WJM82148.1 glycosyltransferase family 4 protein [Pectobacterium brasiliense]
MKKILFISHENELGGATRSLLNLIDGLTGYEIQVLIKGMNGQLTRQLANRGIKHYNYNFFWSRSVSKNIFIGICKEIYNFLLCLLICKKLKKENFSIIHSNSSVINIGLYLSIILNKKHLWHFREFGDLDFSLNYNLPKKMLYNIANKYTERFVFISKALYRHYQDYVPINNTRIIYNGIYLPKGKKEDKFLSETVNIIISGTLIPSKGQMTAVKAIGKLREKGFDARLYLAGKGDLRYIEELKSLADIYNISEVVIFLGYTDDIKTLRDNMDIELVCSKSEAFGRVTIEAMMQGLLVIASNTGANEELINDRCNGYIFKYDDSDDLYEKIKYVFLNKNEAKKVLDRGYIMSRENFIIDHTVRSISELYKELYEMEGKC